MTTDTQAFHTDTERLKQAAEFVNRERAKINALAEKSQLLGAPKHDFFVEAVKNVRPGPLSLRLVVVGEVGSCGRGSVKVQTPPLDQARAVHVAAAVAAVLRTGGFPDVWVALVDEHLEGVALRFATSRRAEAVAYHGSEASLQ